MIVLDTNIISALMLREPDPVLVGWVDRQPRPSIWLTAITLYEVRFGIESLAAGRRRKELEEDFIRVVSDDFQGRVLNFDDEAAAAAASLGAQRKVRGRPIEIRDTLIAGIVLSRRAQLATRNARHFEDINATVIDPWSA